MDKFDKHWKTALQNEKNLHYFMDQLKNPKRSTFFFNEYFNDLFASSTKIIDLGGGNGTTTQFFAKKHPHIEFTCADFSSELLESGETIAKELNLKNLKFKKVDWFDLEDMTGYYDGVISLQTLSWLSEFQKPLKEIFSKITPNWLGISSLFYNGDISTKLEVQEHSVDRYSYSNTYSLNQVGKFCQDNGYFLSTWKDFDIDIDISKPENLDRMSTYTRKTFQGKGDQGPIKRLQISGPVLMNWKNILIQKA